MRTSLLYIYLLALLSLAGCGGDGNGCAHSGSVDSLSTALSSMRYRNSAIIDTLAVNLLDTAAGNNEAEMVAYNAKGYSALMKMDYLYAREMYEYVIGNSLCEIEKLVADVGLMTLSYRVSANREFFDYRASALERIKRVNEDIEYLAENDKSRFYRAKIEFGIVSVCYFSNLAMFRERARTLQYLKQNIAGSSDDELNVYANMIIANNESDARTRLNLLLAGLGYAKSRNITWIEGNYKLLLAITLRDSTLLNEWNSSDPEKIGMLVPGNVDRENIALHLADEAINDFADYGDYYMKIEAIAVKASCHTQRGEYEEALKVLAGEAVYEINDYYESFYPANVSLHARSLDDITADSVLVAGGTPGVYDIPECILSVRREASCAYAGIGDIGLSTLNRDAYLELLRATRDNKLIESRLSIAEAGIPALQWLSVLSALALAVVVSAVVAYHRRRMRYQRETAADFRRMPEVSRLLMSSLPQELSGKEELCSCISELLDNSLGNLCGKTHFAVAFPAALPEELPYRYEFPLIYMNKAGDDTLYVASSLPMNEEKRALVAMIVPHVAVAVEEGMRLANINDEQERAEEQRRAYALYLAEHKRENLLKRVSLSTVTGMRPYIDRIINELRVVATVENDDDAERKLKYVAELTEKLDDLNLILERWIKMRQGELNLKIENFSLAELFSIIEKSSVRLKSNGITLTVSGGEPVKADKALTLFMINTLVDNASKFTPPGGTVTLEAVGGDGYVEVAVSDTGIGISQADIDRILNEKVYDAASIGEDNGLLQPKSKGGGFGLMNCKGIIDKYRKTDKMFSVCSLNIESSKGKGSRFSFRLPKGVLRCIAVLAVLLPSSLFASETLQPMFRERADSVYFANVEGNYESALSHARSALSLLNSYYTGTTGGSDTLSMEKGGAELRWWSEGLFRQDSITIDNIYYNILYIRNEVAVAALALQKWNLYRYNNYIFSTLYTNVHESSGIAQRYESVRKEVNLYEAVIALSAFLLFIILLYYVISYVRHNVIERGNERMMIELNRRLLAVAAGTERRTAKELLEALVNEVYGSLQENMRAKRIAMMLRTAGKDERQFAAAPSAEHASDIYLSAVVERGGSYLSEDQMMRVIPLVVVVDGVPHTVGAFEIVTGRPLSNNEVVAVELVAAYAASVAYHSIERVARSYMALEELEEDAERMKYEENRLHVQNMVMDNCLSVIKHETIYYPSRVRELVRKAMASCEERKAAVGDMRELMDYYNSIFGILSNCAKRELDDMSYAISAVSVNALFASAQRFVSRRTRKSGIPVELSVEHTDAVANVDADAAEYLFESLLDAALKVGKPGRIHLRAIDAGNTVKIELSDSRYTITSEEAAELFTPSKHNLSSGGGLSGMEYLVAKEIVRLHEDMTGRHAARMEARSDVSGTAIIFTLPK